jgi:hypothetical protein
LSCSVLAEGDCCELETLQRLLRSSPRVVHQQRGHGLDDIALQPALSDARRRSDLRAPMDIAHEARFSVRVD